MKRILFQCCVLLTGIFLSQPASAAWQPERLVGLMSQQNDIILSANERVVLRLADSQKQLMEVAPENAVTIQWSEGSFFVNGVQVAKTMAPLDFAVMDDQKLGEQITTVNGKKYCGAVRLLPRGKALTVINRVPVEQYLEGVVPEEMPVEWNIEALKAQAVAARTYSLYNLGRHKADGFDLCATTHCQVYHDLQAGRDNSALAVQQTSGEVLTYKGKLIEALFHADSGGMTENIEEAWGYYLPYIRAVTEVNTQTLPWGKSVTVTEFSTVLAKNKKNIGEIKKLDISPLSVGKKTAGRTSSGRVAQVLITGENGTASVTGIELRNWFGLRSTLFDVTLQGNVVVFQGYGWGHGLGMSQWGAKALADIKEMKYGEILSNYYKGTEKKKLY